MHRLMNDEWMEMTQKTHTHTHTMAVVMRIDEDAGVPYFMHCLMNDEWMEMMQKTA